jgi:hypothetical protein
MNTFLISCVVAVAVAIGAYFVLSGYQQDASQAYTTTSVRI